MKRTRFQRFILTIFALILCLSCASCTNTPAQTEMGDGGELPTTAEQTLLTQTQDETKTEEAGVNKKAAVFILLGQSNATGHRLDMSAGDRISRPLKNVHGLSRTYNQSFSRKQLMWSGYTSDGMNLGEEQDHTYSVANCLAQKWQDAIDGGEDLPDLYIVHISIGAQGVMPKYMWNPNRELELTPGKLGKVKISLYPYTVHFLSLLQEDFAKRGQTADFVGIHWMGGENDFTYPKSDLEASLKDIYSTIFNGFYKALNEEVPTVLYRINCPDRCADMNPEGKYEESRNYINSVFEDLCKENENMTIFDTRNSPDFIPNVRGNGIFGSDCVHYTANVMQWISDEILKEYQART